MTTKSNGVLDHEQICSKCGGPLEKKRWMKSNKPFKCLKCQKIEALARNRARAARLKLLTEPKKSQPVLPIVDNSIGFN